MRRDLVRRAQAGDHDAFAQLVRDALARLSGTAHLILRDHDCAQEAVQDTVLLAWRDIRGLHDPDQFEAWLNQILVRSCYAIAKPDVSRSDAIGPRDDLDEIDRAFRQLTIDQRAVLTLVFYTGLSLTDASIALGVPLGTVDARLHDAIDALRAAVAVDEIGIERRLSSWMTSGSGDPDTTELDAWLVRSTMGARQRPRILVPARSRQAIVAEERTISGRRLGIAIAGALVLAFLLTAGLVVGPQLFSLLDHGRLAGAFRPTGDIPLNAGDLSRPAVAVLSDGRVLVVGGGNQILTAVVFDPATGIYGQPTRDTVIRRGATATTLANSLVLLTGGDFGQVDASSVTAALFDPGSRTVAATNPLSVARAEHTATLLDDGRVLIVGGRNYPLGRSPFNDDPVTTIDMVEIYDPATGAFAAASPLNVARAAHTATKLADGRVLIAGGYTVSGAGAVTLAGQAEVFDPATGLFRPVGRMVVPRGGHSATLLRDGRVLITGGADRYDNHGGRLDFTATAEVFDPKTEVFTRVGPLTTERAGHSATLLPDGRVLVGGGTNDRGDPRSTEVFDPERGTFAPGPTASVGHAITVAPLLADGRILYTGSGPGGSEVFDPRVATQTAVATSSPGTGPALSSPVATSAMRVHPAIVRLGDGRILIAGGDDAESGETLSSAEVFDPATGLASAAGRLSRTLYGPAAILLPDGRVLVVGDDGNGSLLSEVFDPGTKSFGPPPLAVANAIKDHSLIRVAGLGPGRLVLVDGFGVEPVDAATGATGRRIEVCASGGGIALGGNRVLVSCGDGSSATIVDLLTGEIQPTGAQFVNGVSLGDGRVALTAYANLALGASYEYLASTFDSSRGTSTAIYGGSLPPPSGALVAIDGGRLLSFGGNGGRPTTSAVLIDATTGSSREVGPMISPRSDATAIALADGRILVIGGGHVSPDRTDPPPTGAELFDPSRIP